MIPFTGKQLQLIQLLMEQSTPIALDEISQLLHAGRRSVYYIVNKTNEVLQMNALKPVMCKRGAGYFLLDEQKQQLSALLKKRQLQPDVLTPQQRVSFLICYMIYPKAVIHVEDIMQLLKCSRNTVFSDLKNVKEQLKAYGLELRIDLKNGYGIEGKAFNKRAVLLYFLKQLLDEVNYHALPFLDTALVDDYYGRLQKISSEREHEYRQDNLLSIACMLSIIRDSPEQYDFSLMELRDLCETQELDLIDRYFQELNVHERLYLALHLLGSKASRELCPQDDEHDIRIFELSSRLVETFERTACVSFDDKNDLINSIYMHLKLSMYYNRLSIQVVNPLIDEIQKQYKDIYMITQLVCEDLRDLFQMPIIDSEIAYLTMHFGGHLKQGVRCYDEIRILIVCPSGISTSMLLKREIEGLYANVRVVDTASLEHVQEYEQQVDFIVSTIDVQSEVPVIRVHPILSREDKARIASMMMLNFDCYEINNEKLGGLFSIIASYVKETDMDALKRDVLAYLNRGNSFVGIHDKEQLGLLDILQKEDIQVLEQVDSWKEMIQTASAPLLSRGVIQNSYVQEMIHLVDDILQKEDIQVLEQVDSWKEMIQTASAPLLSRGVIQNSYVQEMIHLVDEYGPYILLANSVAVAHAKPEHQTASAPLLSRGVIQNSYVQEMIHLVDEYGPYILLANSVAVAHAKPEHGAFRLGLSLLICHEDVYLDEVSAVRYLFVLSDAAHDKHLNVLHEILQLSRNSTLLAQLDVCTSAAEVRRALLHAFS